MCFYKGGKRSFRAKSDIFVMKRTNEGEKPDGYFRSGYDFDYSRGTKYEKHLWCKWRAFWRDGLESEVFHSLDVEESKRIAKRWKIDTKLDDGSYYYKSLGIFVIPKGTRLYSSDGEIATFGIVYLGPINNALVEKVLAQ